MWPFTHKREQTGGRIVTRGFSAAQVSASLGPWTFDGGFSNSEIAASLSSIRARSRDMQKNSEYFARWLQLFVANVVGDTGFTLKSLAEKSAVDSSVDTEAARFIEEHFWRWATRPDYADETGRKSFVALCRLCAENWARDGEYIVYLDRHAQNPYGIALRVIRPDALDETVNSSYPCVRNGVEVDPSTLRAVAYYFNSSREDPGAIYIKGGYRVRVPASDIVHGFTQHDETQTRGVPLGHASLRKLKMLDEYDFSELVAARDEANTVGVFHAPAGRDGEISPLATNEDEGRALAAKSGPGHKLLLTQGWDYKAEVPQHPNREVTAFKNTMLRDIASGLGVEYACFANDWAGVSFSSVRAGTLAERDQWTMLQASMVEQLVIPVFRAWLASFLTLAASASYGSADFERLSFCEFRGRRWQWVDPLRDVNAAVVAVQHGWKTDAQIASDYGSDFDDNLAESMRVKDAKKKAGVGDSPSASNPSAPVVTDGTEDEEQEPATKEPEHGKA